MFCNHCVQTQNGTRPTEIDVCGKDQDMKSLQEILHKGVVGLSATCVPILLAGGVDTVQAVAIWATWLLGFSARTIAFRSVIAAQKQ